MKLKLMLLLKFKSVIFFRHKRVVKILSNKIKASK